jgi:hypothetical protein
MTHQNIAEKVTSRHRTESCAYLESPAKARELSSVLSSMNFVKRVSTIRKPKALIAALQEHEELKKSLVKKKNKAIAKYL